MNTNEDAIFEEMMGQKAKRLNIIMHGVQECNKRIEWDQKEIEEILKVLELCLTEHDINVTGLARKVRRQRRALSTSTWSMPGVCYSNTQGTSLRKTTRMCQLCQT
jgi:hypothetical protein